MRRRLIVVAVLSIVGPGAHGQEAAPTPVLRHCIPVARIQRTEVVNDRTILFHMLDGGIFKNELPKRCFGLGIDRGFAYTPAAGQLCNVDVIRVVGSGAVCPLGKFVLYRRPGAQGARSPTATDQQQGGGSE